jgi:Xaa-Pro aminopeptidase
MTIEENRRARAAEQLPEKKLDALLITNLHNVRYLTGFTGSNGAVLLRKDAAATLFTDPRYTVQSKQQANCAVKIAKGPLTKSILQEIAAKRVRHIGFEADNMTVSQLGTLRKDLPGRAKLDPASGVIEGLRAIKDAEEIAKIRAAVLSNSAALEAALDRLKVGMTESEFSAEIDYQNRKLGAEAPSFDTIVAAGKRAALPHAHPGTTKIGPGMLLIDMGAFRDGYASDMTRMVHLGPASAKYKRAYDAVLEAQLAAIAVVKPGVTTNAVDRAARSTLKRHGLEKEFVHSTGPRPRTRDSRTAAHRPPRQDQTRSRNGDHHRTRRLYRRVGRHPHRGHRAGYGERLRGAHPDFERAAGSLTHRRNAACAACTKPSGAGASAPCRARCGAASPPQ